MEVLDSIAEIGKLEKYKEEYLHKEGKTFNLKLNL